jgi:hypothetical protein
MSTKVTAKLFVINYRSQQFGNGLMNTKDTETFIVTSKAMPTLKIQPHESSVGIVNRKLKL